MIKGGEGLISRRDDEPPKIVHLRGGMDMYDCWEVLVDVPNGININEALEGLKEKPGYKGQHDTLEYLKQFGIRVNESIPEVEV